MRNYTKKLKIVILLLAILPPIVLFSVFKIIEIQKIGQQLKSEVNRTYQKAEAYIKFEQGKVSYDATELLKHDIFTRQQFKLLDSLPVFNQLLKKYDLDFIKLTNRNGEILFSTVESEQKITITNIKNYPPDIITKELVDKKPKAAFTHITKLENSYYLYAGSYIDQSIEYYLKNMTDAQVSITFDNPNPGLQGTIEESSDGLAATLLSSPFDGTVLKIIYSPESIEQQYADIVFIISITTICLILISLVIGLILTRNVTKEIDNLRIAFADVAEGNFDTPIMAYEEGEFSELADSFSEMIRKLKQTQQKLSTVEKIAAWQTVGRKIAHELKNPLSPISIAADDLRYSYAEQQENFDKILDETTTTIKKEVLRMNNILDEFVSFARMKQSEIKNVSLLTFFKDVMIHYQRELMQSRFQLTIPTEDRHLKLDPDTFMQVLINIIKNGFESKENATVSLTIKSEPDKTIIHVEDDGPGFSEERLSNSFEPFATTKKGGSGLGLVISHRIVNDHNGIMEISNRENGGGRVTITLPN